MKDIKLKDLDKCMRVVLQNCNSFNRMWRNDELQTFCRNPINFNSLLFLAENGYIELTFHDNQIISSVTILGNGLTYFANKKQKHKEFIQEFFSQFLSGFLSGVIVTVIGAVLVEHIV